MLKKKRHQLRVDVQRKETFWDDLLLVYSVVNQFFHFLNAERDKTEISKWQIKCYVVNISINI